MKTHLDGSICDNRKSMPKKSQIAFYWRNKTYDYFNYMMDWGEPSCWACGKWNENCPDLNNPKAEMSEVFEFWNKHSYIERCHIIPKAHKGCNCEANLVLLCKECHKMSPDTKSINSFQTWVRNRESWFQINSSKITQAFKELSFYPKKGDYKILMSSKFKEYLNDNAIFVGGKLATSTLIASFKEFKAEVSENEINQIHDEYEKYKMENFKSLYKK